MPEKVVVNAAWHLSRKPVARIGLEERPGRQGERFLLH